jgi:putative holliday junction resolvase
MPRLLAIDYGKKRTGIAVTDPAQIIANPLTTVPTHTLLDYLRAYTARETVERFVIGLPTQSDGTPSENQQRVLAFAKRLAAALPGIPQEMHDERFTSVLAHRAIADSGIGRRRRETDKGLVDEISACIILQSYMESRAAGF